MSVYSVLQGKEIDAGKLGQGTTGTLKFSLYILNFNI